MTEINKISAKSISELHGGSSELTLRQTLRRCIAGLLVSACLGSVAGFGGLAIFAMSITGAIETSGQFTTLGVLLTAALFPLFLLAAHCNDKVDAVAQAIRIQYCHHHGFRVQ